MTELAKKTAAELRQMEAEVSSELSRTKEAMNEITDNHDLSAKTTDKFTRLQTQFHMLWVRAEAISRAVKVAERKELEDEANRLRAEIPTLEAQRAEAEEKTYNAAYELLRFRDEAGDNWHTRRKHEIRLIAKQAHGPGQIEAKIHNTKHRVEQIEETLRKLDEKAASIV